MIVRIARVKVGHCQAIIKKAPVERLGLFAPKGDATLIN
jgi:hypothetical protein